MNVKNKWKMWLRTNVFLMCVFFLVVQAGRPKKQGFKQFKNYYHIRRNVSSNFGLWPSSFNLATKALISANATCGQNGREEFCRMVEGGKGRCGICDSYSSDPSKRHPVDYAIDGSNRWWQSPALFYGAEYEYVTIDIDLKQIYQITDVIIKTANSLRPGIWTLERSMNGKDYEVWQYFARSDKECLEGFNIPSTKGKPHYFTDSEVICTSFYSKLTPLENGEIHTSLINGRPGANETSPELLEFTKARHVRLRLMGLRGTVEPLPHWFLQDALREKRLFYTIREISIIGRCVCNGHAESCRHNVASGHPECECAHHTCGPNCDKCCPMYNQRQWGPGSSRHDRQCLPCNCHGHATSCHYDENVDKTGLSMDINGNYQGGGVCDNCTAHTIGINCERCILGYYRPYGTVIYADKPCVKCDCDVPGSSGTCAQEGKLAGTCNCLLGYKGKKCEYCAAGFKGWPQCELCPCDNRGTKQMSDCEGNCTCKVNVYGKFCDRCKSGYFSLNSNNPKGCLECYCSGITTLCESTLVTPKKIQTLDNWFTTDMKISTVTKPIWDSKGLFSIGSYDQSTEYLYWLAPEAYIGNKLEYYGSIFTFKVQWVIMRGDTSGRATIGPSIIIVGGNGAKIAHGNDSFMSSNATFNIELREHGWYHIPSDVDELSTKLNRNNYIGEPINRKEFLGVLSNMSYVLLRATFHTDQIESLLEEASFYSEGVTDVEKCSCPSGYSGLSCESCSYGYVQIKTNTTSTGSYCAKCDCNGHSQSCNPDTGECFCEHNTTGENCERCKAGYYGNPLRGTEKDCMKCACPLETEENNFSPSCQLDYLNKGNEKDGGYVCTQCPKGYTGDHCEICDDGYFGNPMIVGNTCKRCSCNGGPCEKITGQCLSCKGNTEGWRCDKCKPGFYGDALMSNCISCQCDPLGAVSQICDAKTGQCECKQRFIGRTCKKCEVGYGNMTALCIKCSCNIVGSKSNICDQQTGLCECKRGVDGFHCDTCQNLHYGLSENGCKVCKCDKYGSKIQACNQTTGKCICNPHYEGQKCDRCEIGYWRSHPKCLPCNCNYNGSISLNCDPETGKCSCKPGVQGQRCDSCQEKYYGNVTVGCKACDLCDREGHMCHPDTGKCVCPKLTTGSKCQICEKNAWGYEPGIGCKPCDCSISGSLNPQCDVLKGKCTCKLGFEGEKCNTCSFGYYNYPNCKRCKCVVAGTRNCNHGICGCSHKGCSCKENVEGKHCDRCKTGTFGMDPDNPRGCIECFCSNRSNSCSASNNIWQQVRTNSVQEVSPQQCVNKILCWNLPVKFTGDLMQSYGGYLRVSSSDLSNFVYLNGNGITLESATGPGGDIKLTENHWKLKSDTNPPGVSPACLYENLTRSCLMVVLQNVSKFQIESRNDGSKINAVLLDKISKHNVSGIAQARSIEQCSCPHIYTSSSCQDPNTGYYRYHPKKSEAEYKYTDRIIGVAKPCQCNNKSHICDKQTGHCLHCANFTTGPYCESCADGYYKNSQGNCSPCLCPTEEQNFAKNCTIRGNQFICTCKPGYSGSKCDKCEDQYWGNPHKKNGSCKACNCNPYGSENLRCDKLTGQCRCKPEFSGKQCAKCSGPREVIQNGICTPCDECTQILFNTLDDLLNELNNTLDLFKNGLHPPWALLNSTLNRYKLLSEYFGNVQRTEEVIKNANITKLEKTIEHMKQELVDRYKKITKQRNLIDNIRNESNVLSRTIKGIDDKINDISRNVNTFDKSYVNVDEALFKAKELLSDITDISNETPKMEHYQNIFNKCRELQDKVDNTYTDAANTTFIKVAVDNVRERLSKFNEVLDQTETTNKLASSKNKRNSKRIDELKLKINEINDKKSTVDTYILELLTKINGTNDLLQDMEKIYKEIDLAKPIYLDINGTDELSEILTIVRDHVRNLQTKVKTYKNFLNFTPDEWTKIDASGAYDKIIKGIELANKEAQKARNIAINTLKKLKPPNDDSLTDKTNLAKAFSDRLQKRIGNLKNLNKDFKKTAEQLEDLKHDILFNGKSNNELNSFLRNILKDITKQSNELERAKNIARNVSSMIASIEHGIKDINITLQYDLTKKYYEYLDLVSYTKIGDLRKKIERTRDEIDKIININFLNLTAIDNVQIANNHTFNFTQKNMSSIKKNIHNLRDVIQNATKRVEMVRYGVNITSCERSYKLKNDNFRSLEIHFKCNTTCVLLYLYDYENNVIKVEYADNAVRVTINNQSDSSKSVKSNDTVLLLREASEIRLKTQASEQSINMGPFYVDKLKIGSLKANIGSEACLQGIILNGQTLGLWKFDSSEGECAGCYGNTNNEDLENVFFNGNGYRKVDVNPKMDVRQYSFRFDFSTFDENSTIFLSYNKMNPSFIALSLKNGRIQLDVQHDNDVRVNLACEDKFNNGNEATVEFRMFYSNKNQNQTYQLRAVKPLLEPIIVTKQLNPKNVFKIRKSEIFIGGVPGDFRSSIPLNFTPFLGNLRTTQIKFLDSYGVEPALDKLAFHKTWFPGNGSLDLVHNNSKIISQIIFSFEPVYIIDNFIMNINNTIDIYLHESSLMAKMNQEQEIKIGPAFANSSHLVNISLTSISVNNCEPKNLPRKLDFADGKIHFHLGKSESRSFTGTIGDIYVNERSLLFEAATVLPFENVEIGRDKLFTTPPPSTSGCMKEMQNTERYKTRPVYKTEPQAFKFGDKPNSFVLIKNTLIGKKFVLEFQFRTFYPNGLLFYSTSNVLHRNSTFYTVLEIQGGDIRLRVQGHRIKNMNIRNRINDGAWHHVQVEQIIGKRKWRFVVKIDKNWKIKERIPQNNFNGDLYLGGISSEFPIHKKMKNELHPFRGCIRSFKINRNLQVVKNNNNVFYSNIGQCFQNVEEGAYFGGDAYAVYKHGFKVNKFLELSFEFKTGEPNGVLLSVSNSGNSPALSVELQNGAVVMTIDMGNGIVSQVTNSPHSDSALANNEWHNITALYSSSELTVNVDGVRKSWVQSDIKSMMDEIEAPLYVGGLPNNAPSGTLKIKENFRGCIRKFKIEDGIMDWTDMKELNNVQLNSCLA